MRPDRTFALRRTDTAMQAAWLLGPWAWAAAIYVGTEMLGWAIGAGLLLLLPVGTFGRRLYRVRLEPREIVVHRTWGRSVRIAYADLNRVDVVRGLLGRSLTLSAADGRSVTVPGALEGFDELATELAARRAQVQAGAGPDPQSPSSAEPGPAPSTEPAAGSTAAPRFSVWAAPAGLLMLGWSALLVYGLIELTAVGRLDGLLAALAAGFFAPGLAYLPARGSPGPLAACFPASQAALWAATPALVWAFVYSAPVGVFTLLGWLSAAYGVGAALSPAAAFIPGADRRSGMVAWTVPLLSLTALGAWMIAAARLGATVEYRGAFVPPAELRADDASYLPMLTEPRNGRWVVMSAAQSGRALIGRLSPVDLTDPTFDDWTFQAAGAPLGVAWSPDGAAAAVLFGRGGRTVETMQLSAVEMIWWVEPQPVRTLRTFRTPVTARSLVWSPDGRQMRLHTGRNAGPDDPSPPRVFRFLAGGDAGEPELVLSDDDLRLRATRSDGMLVFERTDPEGNWWVELRRPSNWRDPDAPARPRVGPDLPDAGGGRVRLPVVGRRVADSPDGRYLVLRKPGAGAVSVYDFEQDAAFELPDPSDGALLPELPVGMEPYVRWSGDGATLLIPPPSTSLEPGSAAVFDLRRRRAALLKLPVAGRSVGWSVSYDGARVALLAEAGSPATLLRRVHDPGSGSTPAAPRGPDTGLRLQRALLTATVEDGRVRCLPLIPAGSGGLESAAPLFLWPDNEEALYVVLRRPRPTDPALRLFRVSLPER
jgi:hypothetical protein